MRSMAEVELERRRPPRLPRRRGLSSFAVGRCQRCSTPPHPSQQDAGGTKPSPSGRPFRTAVFQTAGVGLGEQRLPTLTIRRQGRRRYRRASQNVTRATLSGA
jgi:hypothetical protein